MTVDTTLLEQELPTLQEHTISFPVLSGVRVAQFLVFYVACLFVLFAMGLYCLFFFDLRLLIPFVEPS